MKSTRVLAALLLALAAAGCAEPPLTNRMEGYLTGLQDIHVWDKNAMARGTPCFDAVMGWGPEIWPGLMARLTDDTPTKIYDEMSGRTAKVSDVAFLMLLELFHKNWQDFASDGVFVSKALGNPIFSIKWDRTAQLKVKARFADLLAPQPPP